ncbi:ATP-binding protein [Methanosarcina sp. KYL-1]|uniref:ATP-binding protein n=1 Tax=Methanosarcina sp. KYL-1 TaxID=2602068 RepID=UPI0021015AAC|nr:ATP-binding protein [Methanosarcina sp. KYL-1]MCQ1536868.1 ATP-binding protein [Methanosarcina sp. KYL-1]
MQKPELLRIILSQQSFFQKEQDIIPRDLKIDSHLEGNETVMICGIRGCGKTSFLKWIADRVDGIKVYINFEDIRQEDLELRNIQDIRDVKDIWNFQDILDIVSELYGNFGKEIEESEENGEKQVYYFLEEIQHIRLWERWLDNLYEDGIKVFVTGSNSNFLNSENGTFLQDRARQLKLLPFSFKESLRLKGIEIPYLDFPNSPNPPNPPNSPNPPDSPGSSDSLDPSGEDGIFSLFLRYFENGGFPAVIKNDDAGLAGKYFEEILQKEVIARYDIEDPGGLRELAVFLISNVASEYSFETLKRVSGIGSEGTVRRYLDYLEEAFLLYRVPMLNHSPEKEGSGMAVGPGAAEKAASRKVYAGDTGFFKAVASNYPDSLGLRFENLVFLELLRRRKEVSYFRDRKECDFVVREAGAAKITEVIQVSTYFGNPAVRERELAGLLGAMKEYGLGEGLILTLADEEVLELECEGWGGKENRKIVVKPVWKWMLN